jgi:hypothetical protein
MCFLMKDQKNLGFLVYIFKTFRCHFHFLILKNLVRFSFDNYSAYDEHKHSSVSSISLVHTYVINSSLGKLHPDEEIRCDIICRILGSIFSSFLRSELCSPHASSMDK